MAEVAADDVVEVERLREFRGVDREACRELFCLLLPIFALLLSALFRRGVGAPLAQVRRAVALRAVHWPTFRYITLGVAVAAIYAAFYFVGGSFNGGSDILQRRGYWPTLSGLTDKLPVFPLPFWIALTIVIVPLVAALLVLLGHGLVRALQRGPRDPALLGVTLSMLVILGLTMSVTAYHDSLSLPLLAGLIIFLLARVRGRVAPVGPAVVVLVLFATFGILSLRDLHNWHTAAWRAGQALLAAGVPLTHISGGNEWNYWYLGEEEVRQARAAGRPLSFGVKLIQPEYVISFSPQITWIVDAPFPESGPPYRVCAQLPYERPLHAAPAYVYVLTDGGCPLSGLPQAP